LILPSFSIETVNGYLAQKQHLQADPRPGGSAELGGPLRVTRDIVALHATIPTGPYLSLWARIPGFRREHLDEALHQDRSLSRVLCMRYTLHIVPGDEMPFFHQAFAQRRTPAELRSQESLLVQAGHCQEGESGPRLRDLHRCVLEVLTAEGPSTVQEISNAVPALKAKVQHSEGKSYAGAFSLGSRLVPSMCTQGLAVRAHPRGTWRSSLYEYAALADWLPEVDLGSVAPREARAWLVRHYLAAFGPATLRDVQWWTGFPKGETEEALQAMRSELSEVSIENLGGEYLMLSSDAHVMQETVTPRNTYAFLLPGLDPYLMGYRDRSRFLAEEHRDKVFDRAGNALPTAWLNGRVVGAWGQRKRDGTVVLGLFEPVGEEGLALLENEVQHLESFLDGEPLPQRSHSAFTRALV
jgi:uncharacterized protein YcaQ